MERINLRHSDIISIDLLFFKIRSGMNCVRHGIHSKAKRDMLVLSDPDDLILGIRSILARNHGSLSVDEVAILERTIEALEKLPTVPEPSDKKAQLGLIVGNVLKVFSAFRLIRLLKEFFEDYQDLN